MALTRFVTPALSRMSVEVGRRSRSVPGAITRGVRGAPVLALLGSLAGISPAKPDPYPVKTTQL
jgi:hypothetical protein